MNPHVFHGSRVAGDTYASTSHESFFDMEPSESSESSSSCSYEEVEDALTELPDISHQSIQFLICNNLHPYTSRRNTLQNAETEEPHSLPQYFCNICKNMDASTLLAFQAHENGTKVPEKLSKISVTFKSDLPECVKLSETFHDKNLYEGCWPLGALFKNPFCRDIKNSIPKQWQFTEFCQQKADKKIDTLEEDQADFSDMFAQFSSQCDVTGKTQLMNSFDRYNLAINPMLAKTDWLHTVRNVRDKSLASSYGRCYPCFDFSSVSDSFRGYSESMIFVQGHESLGKAPDFVDSTSAVGLGGNSCCSIQSSASPALGLNRSPHGIFGDDTTGQSVSSFDYPSREKNDMLDALPPSASGVSSWERLMSYPGDDASVCVEDEWCYSVGTFEIPLDVIIDKCILQEILIQYPAIDCLFMSVDTQLLQIPNGQPLAMVEL